MYHYEKDHLCAVLVQTLWPCEWFDSHLHLVKRTNRTPVEDSFRQRFPRKFYNCRFNRSPGLNFSLVFVSEFILVDLYVDNFFFAPLFLCKTSDPGIKLYILCLWPPALNLGKRLVNIFSNPLVKLNKLLLADKFVQIRVIGTHPSLQKREHQLSWHRLRKKRFS